MRKKCPHSELFWSPFSRIRTPSREILRISLNSVQIRENADQNNFECGHFLRSEIDTRIQEPKQLPICGYFEYSDEKSVF